MKFCIPHWNKLRDAIKARGLFDLVSRSGLEVAKRQIDEMNSGERTADNFDPLMGAHNAIVNNALRIGGLAIMQPNPDGSERCPVCYGMQFNGAWEDCIEHAAEESLVEARNLGLAPQEQ